MHVQPVQPQDTKHVCSRPKTVDEVAYQDEVISTLKNSIKTGNVCPGVFSLVTLHSLYCLAAATFAVLWPSRDWQDIHHPGCSTRALRVKARRRPHFALRLHFTVCRPEKWRERTRELNASDERGISVSALAARSVGNPPNTTVFTSRLFETQSNTSPVLLCQLRTPSSRFLPHTPPRSPPCAPAGMECQASSSSFWTRQTP